MIYFVQRESDGAIKIGYTKCIETRLFSLKHENKSAPNLLCVIEGDRKTEKNLHDCFRDSRLEREWFTGTTKLNDFIESAKNGNPIIREVEPKKRTHIVVNISDELLLRVRKCALKKYGILRGQSLVVEEAIKDYLQKKDALADTRA